MGCGDVIGAHFGPTFFRRELERSPCLGGDKMRRIVHAAGLSETIVRRNGRSFRPEDLSQRA